MWLTQVLTSGFCVAPDDIEVINTSLDNYPSAQKNDTILSTFLDQEVALNHLRKILIKDFVFKNTPCNVLPMALLPKKEAGKWRLIVDGSAPEGNSPNDFSKPPTFRMVTRCYFGKGFKEFLGGFF